MGRLVHSAGKFRVYQAGNGAVITHDLIDYKDFHYHVDDLDKAKNMADIMENLSDIMNIFNYQDELLVEDENEEDVGLNKEYEAMLIGDDNSD